MKLHASFKLFTIRRFMAKPVVLNSNNSVYVNTLNDQCPSNVSIIAHRIFDFFYNIYDFIYAKNPVTEKREFWFVPTCYENFMGKIFYEYYRTSNGIAIIDKNKENMVQEVGKKLVSVAPRKDQIDHEFCILDSNRINAWALPGGKIAIYKGLLEALDELPTFSFKREYSDLTKRDKIAAVLSHEIVHTNARHTAKRLEKVLFLDIIIVATMALLLPLIKQLKKNSITKALLDKIANLSLSIYLLANSRSNEFEADKYGMWYMKKAGYNPKAALWLQELFELHNPTPTNIFLRTYNYIFSTHPSSLRRLEENRKTLAEIESATPSTSA